MTLLDDLEADLAGVARVGVLTRLATPRLNFPGPNDIRIFIPDIHLLSSAARARFDFRGNHPSHALLKATLARLARFRTTVKTRDPSAVCAVYFIGDFLDLWREGAPGSDVGVTAARIAAEHQDLVDLACAPELKARFLMGNHDFELCRIPSFAAADRRYFFPPDAPSSVAVHGDVFDWIEDFPDQLNQAILYYLSPFTNLLDHFFSDVATLIRNANPNHLGNDTVLPVPNQGAPAAISTTTEEAQGRHDLFKRAFEARNRVFDDFNIDLRTMFIGHTHGPRIVPYASGDDFFALVDTGGWLDDSKDATAERGMLTAFSENEIRIYQLSPI